MEQNILSERQTITSGSNEFANVMDHINSTSECQTEEDEDMDAEIVTKDHMLNSKSEKIFRQAADYGGKDKYNFDY